MEFGSYKDQSIEEIKKFISNSNKLSLLGTGCSYSWINDSKEVLDFKKYSNEVILHEDNTITVEAGATWLDILKFIDGFGLSLPAIQSAPYFTVGGSISANIHGRSLKTPMLKDQIISMEIITANGEYKICSPHQNSELFFNVIGGMGLFGVIYSVRLKTTPNKNLAIYTKKTKLDNIEYEVRNALNKDDIDMLHINPSWAENEVILKYYQEIEGSVLPKIKASKFTGIKFKEKLLMKLFQWTILNNKRFNKFRWKINSKYSFTTRMKFESKNNAFSTFSHPKIKGFRIVEYFLPLENYQEFLYKTSKIFEKHKIGILFTGSRVVFDDLQDKDWMSYSKDFTKNNLCLSLVLNYICDDVKEELIAKDVYKVLVSLGGKVHLPYNISLSEEEFKNVYREFDVWKSIKLKYDKYEKFVNGLWKKFS